MRVDLLQKIRDVLREIDPATLDMSWWWGKNPGCGCAIGHAWQNGVFADTGLEMIGYTETDLTRHPQLRVDANHRYSYFAAISKVLDMDRDTVEYLFDHEQYPDEDNISPEEVIDRINEVLEEHHAC